MEILTYAKKKGIEFIDEDGEFINGYERLADANFVIIRNSRAFNLFKIFKIKVDKKDSLTRKGYPKILKIKENNNEQKE